MNNFRKLERAIGSSFFLIVFALVLRAISAPSAPLGPGSYAVHDLGTLGGIRSEAYDINDDGVVTGYSYAAAGSSYGFTSRNGVMRKLGAFPGGKNSVAYSRNGGGTVVGFAEGRVTRTTYFTNGVGAITTNTFTSNYFKACRWSGNSIMPLEGLLSGGAGHAKAVNDGDVIAGNTGWTFPDQRNTNFLLHVNRAVRWGGAGSADDLGPGSWSESYAYGINNLGDVVGTAYLDVHSNGMPSHATLFGGTARDLHTLTHHSNSVALAINGLRQVVGYSYNVPTHVFDEPMFWSEATGMKTLKTPSGDPYGQALDINDAGTAVGFVGRSGTACMWLNAGQTNESLVLLQTLLPPAELFRLQIAAGINAGGEITGYGAGPGAHAFLLYPTNTRHRITGTLQFIATDTEGITLTNALADIAVELLAERGGSLLARESSWLDSAGRFSFLMPAYVDTRYALKFSLHDRDGLVAVYDISRDTNNPGWLRTPTFDVTADTRADVVMVINANTNDANFNETSYTLNGGGFAPALEPPGGPAAVGAASNTGGERFPHLAAIYRYTRLAARFAVDRLGLEMPLVPVHAFEPGSWGPWSAWRMDTSGNSTSTRSYGPGTRFRISSPAILIPDIASAYNEPFVGASASNPNGDARQTRTVPAGAAITNLTSHPLGRNRPDNREFHEYGHLIMKVSPIAGAGAFPPRLPGDRNHSGLLNGSSADSWIEGFAEFISPVISDVMLDRQEKERPDDYLVWSTPIDLDDFHSYAAYLPADPTANEEIIVASLLWDVYDGLGTTEFEDLNVPLDNLWQLLAQNTPPLVNFKAVTEALLTYSTNLPFVLSTTGLVGRLADAGLYDDLTFPLGAPGWSNGVFETGETLGLTSWNPMFPQRPASEPLEGTFVSLEVKDGAGTTLGDVRFDIRIEYDAPLEHRNKRYTFTAPGVGPHGIPLRLPPHSSRARIRANKPGYAGGDEFVITSEAWRAAPKSREPGLVDPFFGTHTFVLLDTGVNLVLGASPPAVAVPAGGRGKFTLAVTNLGPQAATSVVLTSALPAGVSFRSATSSQGACGFSNGVVTCSLNTLGVGAGAKVDLQVSRSSLGSQELAFQVRAGEIDLDELDNTVFVTLEVAPVPSLQVSRSAVDGSLTIEWPTHGVTWMLEASRKIGPGEFWTPVPFEPVVQPDGTATVRFFPPPFTLFFRLRHP